MALVTPAARLIRLCQLEHLVGHVESVGHTSRGDPTSREQDINAAARAEIEDVLARLEIGDRHRVGAADARAATASSGSSSRALVS